MPSDQLGGLRGGGRAWAADDLGERGRHFPRDPLNRATADAERLGIREELLLAVKHVIRHQHAPRQSVRRARAEGPSAWRS
jgi:hypothetical protein